MVWTSLLACLFTCLLAACLLAFWLAFFPYFCSFICLFVFVCLLEFLLLLISATRYIDHRLALNPQKSSYLCLLNAEIKGVCHHSWLHLDFCASSSLGDCLPDSGPIYNSVLPLQGSLFAVLPSYFPIHS